MSSTIEYIIRRILTLSSERNISINGLARQSGLAPTTLKNILGGSSLNPGIITLQKICSGLGISLIEFFDTEEYRTLEREIE